MPYFEHGHDISDPLLPLFFIHFQLQRSEEELVPHHGAEELDVRVLEQEPHAAAAVF